MSNDPLMETPDQQGLCGYLHTATLCTNDLDSIRQFFVSGMGMSLTHIELSSAQLTAQRQLWALPQDMTYDYYHLHRSSVPSLINIRLLVMHSPVPAIHKSYSSLELGPFSLGFPNLDQKALDAKLSSLGIQFMAPMQEGTIPRPDGSEYRYWETIYEAPDYLHAVGIERGDGMTQLTPCDPSTKLGGPGYSAQVIQNSDHFLSFLTEVLDLELRADRHWEASPGSALGIPEGTPFRFSLVYAKGTIQNHFLFLDFGSAEVVDTGIPKRIPNRGLGAWTLETYDMDQVIKNAKEFGSEILSAPITYSSPIFGSCIIASIAAPNGFIIEVFEKR